MMNKHLKYAVLFTIAVLVIGCGKGNGPDKKGEGLPAPDEGTKEEVSGSYTNPVFEPILADPTVIRDPGTGIFYAVGTEDNWGDGKGSRLMPVLRSTDLVNWRVSGAAFITKPAWKNSGFLWAADLNMINGMYFLYYSYSLWGDTDPGIGLATSPGPSVPFVDHGKLFTSSEVGVPNSIDPLYWEEGEKKYLFWGSFSSSSNQGTYGIELAPDGRSVPDLSKKFKIAAGDFEGVMLHRRDGYYYFFGSKGGCCSGASSTYHVRIARSTTLAGPYLDKNGNDIRERGKGTLFLQGNAMYAGPGHNARLITDDEGTDWFIYHAIDKERGTVASGASRRALMLDRVTWVDGWPVIEGNSPSVTAKPAPVFKKK
ncbi:family 43 glycosylhydrolase [Sphingobacterium sp. SGG-5]|uniref:family 43 glycosylhydrolase n=1 Tax=Sphingobacterium sp. SGG-5 TaxID=2710881 RepID=UPI001F10B698|nr:family 43 glycosylhydrolase [Sphingobacterium sp. SGG-5]